MTTYEFITDGAYSSSRKQGGAAVVVLRNGEKVGTISKGYKNCTNNQMEVVAIILALCSIKKVDRCVIISDSMYALGCAFMGWKRKKNIGLWKEFDKIYKQAQERCPNIEYKHVKGHSGDKWNELADQLAVEASQLC